MSGGNASGKQADQYTGKQPGEGSVVTSWDTAAAEGDVHLSNNRGSVVDLTFACQVAIKNKQELQAMCVSRGLTTKARWGKAELIKTLLTLASEPRSSPQSAEPLFPAPITHPQQESHQPLDVVKQRDAVIEIFTMHMASSMEDWMLTTLHLSKACLVCHAWKKIFSQACLSCHLDSRGLTRQGFMRELKRPAQVRTSDDMRAVRAKGVA